MEYMEITIYIINIIILLPGTLRKYLENIFDQPFVSIEKAVVIILMAEWKQNWSQNTINDNIPQ